MVELFEKKNNKFYIRGNELPTHIDGKKVLDVTSIEKKGIMHPFIELEDDRPPITTIDNKQTIKIRYVGNSKKNYCKLIRFIFHKNEWYIIDKETYLKSIFQITDNEFEIDINGEVVVINDEHKQYIIDKLNGGE